MSMPRLLCRNDVFRYSRNKTPPAVLLVSAICVAFVLLGSIRTFYNVVMDLGFDGICKNFRIP